MLLNMVAQVVSLGAVVPFLGVLVNPEAIFNYSVIADLGLILGISSANQLLLPLTIVFVVSDFIECQPESYNTFAGEQGIHLSGGQRQCIGSLQCSVVTLSWNYSTDELWLKAPTKNY